MLSNNVNDDVAQMKLLEESYGDVRIFSERPYGYKRYIVLWSDGTEQIYSGIWYRRKQVIRRVEKEIDRRTKKI